MKGSWQKYGYSLFQIIPRGINQGFKGVANEIFVIKSFTK